MAIFKDTPDDWQRLDYTIFQNGWSNLYWRQDILDNDINWFNTEKFEVIDFDCTKWSDHKRLHRDLKDKLNFPDYYGNNLNALNDCLSDIEMNDVGLVVVFRHFQFLDKKIAHSLLDIFANNSRRHILFGNRLLTLVQVDNPNYEIDDVGACPVSWNGR